MACKKTIRKLIIGDKVGLTVDQEVVDKAGFLSVRSLLPLDAAAARRISDKHSPKKGGCKCNFKLNLAPGAEISKKLNT